MAFVGVFRSLDNVDQFANFLFDGAYFPECNVVFVGLEKDFIARIELFLMGSDGFLELRSPWNESVFGHGLHVVVGDFAVSAHPLQNYIMSAMSLSMFDQYT